MSKRIDYLKKSISKYSLKLDQKGFVANHDGNISVKIDEGFLATPTAEAKAVISEDMVITLDHSGKKTKGLGSPFSEIKLHLSAYKSRPGTFSVIHAHPPFSTALGLTETQLKIRLPEAIVSIGDVIPVVPYTFPGTKESEAVIESVFKTTDVCIIAGNGVLAIGDDLEQAYLRLELVEHLSQIEYYASQRGSPLDLPKEDVEKLLKKRKSIGLGPQEAQTEILTDSQPNLDFGQDKIKNMIAEEIKKALKEL